MGGKSQEQSAFVFISLWNCLGRNSSSLSSSYEKFWKMNIVNRCKNLTFIQPLMRWNKKKKTKMLNQWIFKNSLLKVNIFSLFLIFFRCFLVFQHIKLRSAFLGHKAVTLRLIDNVENQGQSWQISSGETQTDFGRVAAERRQPILCRLQHKR